MFGILKSLEKIVVFIKGKSYTAKSESPEYEQLQKAIEEKAPIEEVEKIVDTTKAVKNVIENTSVKLDEGVMTMNGKRIPDDCGLHASTLKEKGILDKAFVRFLERLMANPDPEARKDLYSFIVKGKMPITDSGHFCAYKVVRHDFKDKHTGTMDNSPGKEVKMDRKECDSNRNRTCSRGLHFCSSSYIPQFRSSGRDKVVMLLIDPKDVVSIPADYNDSKGRACFYKVIKEIGSDDLDDVGKVQIEKLVKDVVSDAETATKTKPKQPKKSTAKEASKEPSKEATNDVKNQKLCPTCKQTLPLDSFSNDKSKKDGKRYQCKACTKVAKKKNK